MEQLRARLGALKPSRILDLATGAGNFAAALAGAVGSYDELVAVDSVQRAVDAASKNLAGLRGARAELADATALPYPDGSFGLVGIANSLHHFQDPARVLAEALRVLEPGGWLVVFEMHREAATEPELNHARIHAWWGLVDTAGGVHHAGTFGRARFRKLLELPAFAEASWDEVPGPEGDPKEPGLMAELEGVFGMYRKKIDALPDPGLRAELLAQGEKIEASIQEHGFRSAPSILFVGRKA